MTSFPCLVRSVSPSGEPRYSLGEPLVDGNLEFVARRCRPNTVRAVAFDLKVFFSVVDEPPVTVGRRTCSSSWPHQRGDRTVVRLTDRESGLVNPCGAPVDAFGAVARVLA
jgi:integrase/recombinase XerD